MRRAAYLENSHVGAFLEWAEPIVAGTRPLPHSWHSPKWGSWSCETLFDAYRSYDWPFKVVLPGGVPCSGRSYDDTVMVLDELSRQLREGIQVSDATRVLEAAVAVVRWGQVRRNEQWLHTHREELVPSLIAGAHLLDPEEADLLCLSKVGRMNSGFSKIYSLLVDGFPIYDSRVACALASLVRLFCEQTERRGVPAHLAFGIPPSRARQSRNPSTGHLTFRGIWSARGYAQTNVKAAWLLDALSARPPFDELGPERQRALQSAMFMIGYKPLTGS